MTLLLRALVLVGCAYLLYALLAFLFQRTLLYPGRGRRPSASPPREARQVWLEASFGRVESWYLPAQGASDAGQSAARGAPALMFAHGNGELIEDWPHAFTRLREHGVAALLVEFPGYGRSAGSPSEQAVAETMRLAYRFLEREPSVDEDRIVLYGRSLGGGAVCTLLASERPAAVVLQATFTSLAPFARALMLPPLLLRDRYDNRAALRRYDGPVLVVHGRKDELVPFRHGEQLARVGPHVRFSAIDCGHNDCGPSSPEIEESLLPFLRSVLGDVP